MRTALRLSPGYAGGWFRLGVVLVRKGQGEAALEAMNKEQAENWRLPGLALAYIALNRGAEADAALKKAVEKYGDTMAFQIAEPYAYRGDRDQAFEWLERAYRQRDGGLALLLKTDPLFQDIKHDPRYAAMLRRLKLPEG